VKRVDRNHDTGDGQARTLGNLKITTRNIDPDYRVILHDLTRGETGLLKVFSLMPNTAGKPSFEARLDDGSPGRRRPPDLDIDIRGVSNTIARDFKAERKGYVGHHADRSPNPNQRIFDVEIAIPAAKLFEGEVSFNVTFSMGISLSGRSTMTVNETVTKATIFTKVRNFLCALYRKLRSLHIS